MYGIIYKATNKFNGKVYIGQTTKTLKRRIIGHKSHSNCPERNYHFMNAFRKYGEQGFDWKILYECKDLKELNEKEIYYINHYNSYKVGYNCTIGGEGTFGYKLTEDHKMKLRQRRGKISSSSKKYVITTPEGEEFYVIGLADFCRNYTKCNFNRRNLLRVAQDGIRRKTHRNHKCRYYNEETDKHIFEYYY